MGHVFSHLSKTDRYKIEALLNQGHTKRKLRTNCTCISARFTAKSNALAGSIWTVIHGLQKIAITRTGQEKRYRENLAAKGAPLKIGRDFELAEYIERKIIVEDRSPAAALAEIRLEGRTFKTSICVSTLYSYITKGVFLSLTNSNLPEKSKRKREYKKVKKTGKRASYGKNIENARMKWTREALSGIGRATQFTVKKTGQKPCLC